MKNSRMCKIILIIIATLLVFSIIFDANTASAADTSNGNLLTLTSATGDNNATNNTTNNATNNTVNNTVNQTNNTVNNTTNRVNNTVNKTNKVNTTAQNNNNLPHTGIEDHKGLFIVLGVCAVSAFYAYRKTNSYNEIR